VRKAVAGARVALLEMKRGCKEGWREGMWEPPEPQTRLRGGGKGGIV
jgi:hypothetical protein